MDVLIAWLLWSQKQKGKGGYQSTEVLSGGRLVHAGVAGFGLVQPQVNLSR